HDNVQGATDVGPNPDSLPGYYGLAPGSFAHWARVWNVDLNWLKKQYPSEAMMGKPGITVSRWIDAVTEKNENIDQDSNLRAVIYWGHAPNSQSRGLDMLEAMKKLDLMVAVDPTPPPTAAMEDTLRELNRGAWTIGYTGQSPERLQAHMRNMHVFDVKTLRARGGKDAKTGYDLTGDYFGLPWPCYGTAAIKHPGSPNLYDTS